MWDAESEGSGGVVPYRYRQTSFVNGLQWAIGLEMFLLAEDPGRVFFTTDHPNGAPFTCYPQLFRLLMDYQYRLECLEGIHPDVIAITLLKDLKKEFSLYEIALMTRSAAASLLGLHDRGHLMPGAIADIAVYTPNENKEIMFDRAALVFKNGQLVVREGDVVERLLGKAQIILPHYDPRIQQTVQRHFDRFYSLSLHNFMVNDVDFVESDQQRFISHDCLS
jgi:formylmethanofuran dehydrogenase subunit A